MVYKPVKKFAVSAVYTQTFEVMATSRKEAVEKLRQDKENFAQSYPYKGTQLHFNTVPMDDIPYA